MTTCTSLQLFGIIGWMLATALMLMVVFLSFWSLEFRDSVKDKLVDLRDFILRRNRR